MCGIDERDERGGAVETEPYDTVPTTKPTAEPPQAQGPRNSTNDDSNNNNLLSPCSPSPFDNGADKHTDDNLERNTGRNARDNGLGHDDGNSYVSTPNCVYGPGGDNFSDDSSSNGSDSGNDGNGNCVYAPGSKFQCVLSLQQDNGEIWSALGPSISLCIQPVAHSHLGHCYLMQDDLQKAYSAYQHALCSLPNPKVSANHAYGVRELCLISTGIVVWDRNPLHALPRHHHL